MPNNPQQQSQRVVVVGGGVGALEAAIAVRALAGDTLDIDVVAPCEQLTYRPLTVAEPFGYVTPPRIPISRLARDHRLTHRRDVLVRVDAVNRSAVLRDGGDLVYDALVVAVGAGRRAWLEGALTFHGPAGISAYRTLLDRLAGGEVRRVLFAVPPEASWTLPLYELALLTATWVRDHGLVDTRLTVATSEPAPLDLFGHAAAGTVRTLLESNGVDVLTSCPVTCSRDGRVTLDGREAHDVDAVVTLPQLVGPSVPGLPTDSEGFIPVDEYGAVPGIDAVYAVGDTTSFPVKQGGLAAQQAEAAATAIAARLGAHVQPIPFGPVVRGVLLTGVASAYLRTRRQGDDQESTVAFDPLWWPRSKITARYLAPYLVGPHEAVIGPNEPLVEPRHEPEITDYEPDLAAKVDRDRDDVRRIMVEFAEADARAGNHASALHWLEELEALEGSLSPEHLVLRQRWRNAQTR